MHTHTHNTHKHTRLASRSKRERGQAGRVGCAVEGCETYSDIQKRVNTERQLVVLVYSLSSVCAFVCTVCSFSLYIYTQLPLFVYFPFLHMHHLLSSLFFPFSHSPLYVCVVSVLCIIPFPSISSVHLTIFTSLFLSLSSTVYFYMT